MSPFNAFQFIQGLETLSLRIERQCKNAEKLAVSLRITARFPRVLYPKLKENKKNIEKYFDKGLFGNLIGFHLKGGYSL